MSDGNLSKVLLFDGKVHSYKIKLFPCSFASCCISASSRSDQPKQKKTFHFKVWRLNIINRKSDFAVLMCACVFVCTPLKALLLALHRSLTVLQPQLLSWWCNYFPVAPGSHGHHLEASLIAKYADVSNCFPLLRITAVYIYQQIIHKSSRMLG